MSSSCWFASASAPCSAASWADMPSSRPSRAARDSKVAASACCCSSSRVLLPASALAGGSLLVFADTLARTVVAPQQLPVGVLTALIGVPVFLFLLTRDAKTRR